MTTVIDSTLIKSPEAPSSPRSTKHLVFLVLGILASVGLGIGLGHEYSLLLGVTTGCSLGVAILGIFFITRSKALSSKGDLQKTVIQTISSPPNSLSSRKILSISPPLRSNIHQESSEVSTITSSSLTSTQSTLPELLSKGFSHHNRNYMAFSLHHGSRANTVVDVDVILINQSNLLISDVLRLYLDKYNANCPEQLKLESIENCAIFCFDCKIPHHFPITRLPFHWLDVAICDKDQSLSHDNDFQGIEDMLRDSSMPRDVTLKATFDGAEWEFTASGLRTVSEMAKIWFKLHEHRYQHKIEIKNTTYINASNFQHIFLNREQLYGDITPLRNYFERSPHGAMIQKELVFTLPNCTKVR